jgi:hypothetical protein
MTPISHPANQAIPEAGHLDDLKLAASNTLGAEQRALQAAMTLKSPKAGARTAGIAHPGTCALVS